MTRRRRRPAEVPARRSSPEQQAADRRLFEEALESIDDERLAEKHEEPPAPVPRARLRRRLARADFRPDAEIDLHGLDRRQAVLELDRCVAGIARPRHGQTPVLLIIHGKGRGTLAARVLDYLDRHSQVAEHCRAPRRLGGAGARLARLRRLP